MSGTRKKKHELFFTQDGGRGFRAAIGRVGRSVSKVARKVKSRFTHKSAAHHEKKQAKVQARSDRAGLKAQQHAVGSERHSYYIAKQKDLANSARSRGEASKSRREADAISKSARAIRSEKQAVKAAAAKEKKGSEEHKKLMEKAAELKKKQKDAEEAAKQKSKEAKKQIDDAKMKTSLQKTRKKVLDAKTGQKRMGLPALVGPMMSALSNAAKAIQAALAAAATLMAGLAGLAGAFGGGSSTGDSISANPAAQQCMSTKTVACNTKRDELLTKQIGKGGNIIPISVIINADIEQAKCLKKAQESCGVGAKSQAPPLTPLSVLPKKSDDEFTKAWRASEKAIGLDTPINHTTAYPFINQSVNESIKNAATDEDKQAIYLALAFIMDASNKARYLAMTPK